MTKYNPEEILQILTDFYNYQAVFDSEIDSGETLTFNKEKNFIQTRNIISDNTFISAEGWSVIEDYGRLDKISSRFNELNLFINRCALSNTDIPQEIKKQEDEIFELKKTINKIGDRNVKSRETKKLQSIESNLRKTILELTESDNIEEWLVEGLHLFVDSFLPNRLNLRLYPLEEHPDFQILANLKKECFVDSDFENFLFSYGAEPNIKFKILGMITSIPNENGQQFDTMSEYDLREEEQLSEKEGLERAFRGMFRQKNNLEQFVRYSRFPNIIIYPIAVYREIKIKGSP